jgi:hypothetical protein
MSKFVYFGLETVVGLALLALNVAKANGWLA